MAKISREDVLKIAHISNIAVYENEIESIREQLENILTYAARVQEVIAQAEESTKAINVFRQDVVISTDPEPILAQAPEREERFFVVPKILDSNS